MPPRHHLLSVCENRHR